MSHQILGRRGEGSGDEEEEEINVRHQVLRLRGGAGSGDEDELEVDVKHEMAKNIIEGILNEVVNREMSKLIIEEILSKVLEACVEEQGLEPELFELDISLNDSMRLSEKLSLSIQELDEEEEMEGGDDFNDEESDDYEASDAIGFQYLKALDPDFMASPRLLVRGIYKGQVLELVVRRKTSGMLVSWTMSEMVHKKIVLNVHLHIVVRNQD